MTNHELLLLMAMQALAVGSWAGFSWRQRRKPGQPPPFVPPFDPWWRPAVLFTGVMAALALVGYRHRDAAGPFGVATVGVMGLPFAILLGRAAAWVVLARLSNELIRSDRPRTFTYTRLMAVCYPLAFLTLTLAFSTSNLNRDAFTDPGVLLAIALFMSGEWLTSAALCWPELPALYAHVTQHRSMAVMPPAPADRADERMRLPRWR